ncbi:MAG: ParB N-terminal domain-containing protein [Chloroflexota bacterium]|nr:ParB N-terminal domain-containing protein [Chloroflexota bacterium]
MSSRERRRKIQDEENLLFANPNTLDPKTADAIGFGLGELALDIAAADSEFQPIEAVSIHEIHPNSIQPRYSIPHDLAEIFVLHPKNIVDIFERWIVEVQLERGQKDYDILNYLLGTVTDRGERAESEDGDAGHGEQPPSTKELALMKLIDLAASIRRDGLSNPISLVQRDDGYEIETGERRWLAYHILYWKFGDGDKRGDGSIVNWSRIPARIVKQVDVWRQASENNARDNLNAISRARQLALLLMDLHGWQHFSQIGACANEQAFYAQVADGKAWRIPRGQGERLVNAMGLSDAGQLRQYRALLRLPGDLWRKGDDEDLSEGELRRMKASLDSVTRVTVPREKRKKDALARLATDATLWRNKLRKEINAVDSGNRPRIRKLIEAEIRQLLRLMADIDESES